MRRFASSTWRVGRFSTYASRLGTQHHLLTHCLPVYVPEIESYYHASGSDWLLTLLHAFPTPAVMTSLSMEDFVKRAWSIAGRKISKQRPLKDIYRTAQSSLGLPVSEDSEAVAMFRTVSESKNPG